MHLPFDKDCCALNISVIIVQLTMETCSNFSHIAQKPVNKMQTDTYKTDKWQKST